MSDLIVTEKSSAIAAVKQKLNHDDANTVTLFGIDSQRKLGQYSNEMLTRVKAQDTGALGDAIVGMLTNLNRIDVDTLRSDQGFLKRLFNGIPGVSRVVDKTKEMIIRCDSVSQNLDEVSTQMSKGHVALFRDNSMFESMHIKQKEYIREITTDIEGGRAKLKEVRETIIPELTRKIEKPGEDVDPLELEQLNDYVRFADQLDKKIAELATSKTQAVLVLPQIRMIQDDNTLLMEKINSAIYNIVPVWRSQVVIALGIENQRKVKEMFSLFRETTNEMLVKNAEGIHRQTVEIAKETEKTTIDITTLDKMNKLLFASFDDMLKAKEQGQRDRAQLETKLTAIENQVSDNVLKNAQKTIAATSTRQLGS